MRRAYRSICVAITLVVEFVRIVDTTHKASTVTSASQAIIDHMDDIGTRLTFVSLASVTRSSRQAIVPRRRASASVALSSRNQTVTRVPRATLAIQIVDHASAI